jgi:hypothetical protein
MTSVTLNHENGAARRDVGYGSAGAPAAERGRFIFGASSLCGKLAPDIDTHHQLLLPLVGKYAR